MTLSDTLKKVKILIVDDDQWIRNSLTYYFKKKTLFFAAVENAELALELLAHETFDIIICDYKLPGIDGLTFFRRISSCSGEAIKILITAYGTDEVAAEAELIGISAFIQKPFTTSTIETCFCRALENRAGLVT